MWDLKEIIFDLEMWNNFGTEKIQYIIAFILILDENEAVR